MPLQMPLQKLKSVLDRLGLKKSLDDIRFRLTRPQWWIDQQNHLALLRTCFRGGDLCFDVGANNGGYSGSLLALGAKIVAVEPQPSVASAFKLRHKEQIENGRITLIELGVGAEPGTAKLMFPIVGAQIASMSQEWITRVKQSGRFKAKEWDKAMDVEITTLDALIGIYGMPAFCKIDVEGFEPEVLKGLTKPIEVMSFEYTPENHGHAKSCIETLSPINDYRFNICIHTQFCYFLDEWLDPKEAIRLSGKSNRSSGDGLYS